MDHRKAALLASITAPSPSEWGPHLWRMLHWLAEHVGTQKSPILINDEATSWKKLLKLLQVVIPCALCKGHYTEYYNTHFDAAALETQPNGPERRDLLRRWLWELHEDVNNRREVAPENRVPFESLTEVCSQIDFPTERDKFYSVLTRALHQNIVGRENVIQFRNTIVTLYGLYRVLGRR